MMVSSRIENPMLRIVGTARRLSRSAFLATSPANVMTLAQADDTYFRVDTAERGKVPELCCDQTAALCPP